MSLLCHIFGHKFIKRDWSSLAGDYAPGWCLRCGARPDPERKSS